MKAFRPVLEAHVPIVLGHLPSVGTLSPAIKHMSPHFDLTDGQQNYFILDDAKILTVKSSASGGKSFWDFKESNERI